MRLCLWKPPEATQHVMGSKSALYKRIIKHWCDDECQWLYLQIIQTTWSMATAYTWGRQTYMLLSCMNAPLAFLFFLPQNWKGFFSTQFCTIWELPRLQCSWPDMKITANSQKNVSLRKLKGKIGSGGNWQAALIICVMPSGLKPIPL